MADAAALFAALLLLVAAEDGLRAAARVALLAPAVSPGGALALHLAGRERRLARIGASADGERRKTE